VSLRRLAPAVLAALALGAAAVPDRPIRIGSAGADLDACPSVGQVSGTNPRGDHFLNVRSAPSTSARVLHRLKPDATVIICETSADGKWFGVIYADMAILGVSEEDALDAGPGADCGISSPVAKPRAYRGPCKSGWVSARFVTIIAG
jgi:hypothetical protein